MQLFVHSLRTIQQHTCGIAEEPQVMLKVVLAMPEEMPTSVGRTASHASGEAR